jgi:hypothetical protein
LIPSTIIVVLTLRAFLKRRAEFNQFLASNSSLTVNRYFRLMGLATTEILLNTPVSVYGIYLNIVDNPIQPWKGWADAHFNYSAVDLIPAFEWRSTFTSEISLELSRWSLVFCAFLFFGFFGFADEARKRYRLAFWAVAKPFGFTPSTKFVGKYVECVVSFPDLSWDNSRTWHDRSQVQLPKHVASDTFVVRSLPIYNAHARHTTEHGSISSSTLRPLSVEKSDGSLCSSPLTANSNVESASPAPSLISSRYTHDLDVEIANYSFPAQAV